MQIASLGDFVSALSAKVSDRLSRLPSVISTDDGVPRVGKPFDFWYRGERDSEWNLQPKVFRSQYMERALTNRFRVLSKSRHGQLPNYDNYGLFLGLMQHYGLPTRLLDWSTSPLVALYFAVERYIYEPGLDTPTSASVWILDPYLLNQIEIGETATPSIEGWSVRKFLRPAFTDYGPLSQRFQNLPEDYLPLVSDQLCAVMGAETDPRMFVQQGSFTIHNSSMPLQSHSSANAFLDRIVIPAGSVRRIADELFLCGLRKSTLFPDLTNLSEDLAARN